jgi:hypothetical protein
MSDDFDPDAYLAQKTAEPDTSDFDPDLYLDSKRETSALESGIGGAMRGASMGFIDELSGAGEAAGRFLGVKGMGGEFSDLDVDLSSFGDTNFKENYKQGRDKKRAMHSRMREANPDSYLTGEVTGGVATGLLTPGLNAVKGLRGAVGVGAGLGGVSGLGNSEASDAQGLAVDTLSGVGIGAAGGAVGFGVGKGLEKASNFVSQKAAPAIEKMLPIGKKANAAEIEAAAKRLGFEATPGMTNASESVQKLESSLHQAPTLGGWLTRRGTKPVVEGMKGATDDLTSGAAQVGPWESGQKAKNIITDSVKKKFKPSQDAFEELAEHTKHIPLGDKSRDRVARNILNIPENKVFDFPSVRSAVKALENNPNVDQIKQLRGMIGAKAKSSADKTEASALWQVYAKLGRLEENTIKRAAIETARTKPEGNKIAAEMLSKLKGAKSGYAKEMGALDDFAQSARMGKSSGGPSDFPKKLDAITNERMHEKLLPLEDARMAQKLQTQFPEAFDTLKGARLRDLSDGVHVDGEAVPGRFLQKTKNLNPEAQDMLFGAKAPKLDDLRTVNQALPDKVGPSGTQQALDVAGMLNPMNQVRDLARYGAYKATSSETMNKVAQFLRSQPKFANMAETNPKAFQAAVLQFAERVQPKGGMYRAAGFDPTKPGDDEKARSAFTE